jgi:hypothetical protein
MNDLNAEYVVTRNRLIEACVRWHTSEQDQPNAYYAAELEYCEDMIAEAALAFVQLLNASA